MLEKFDARTAIDEILKVIDEDANLSEAVEAYCEKHLHLFWHVQDFKGIKGITAYYFPDHSKIVDFNGNISIYPSYEIHGKNY